MEPATCMQALEQPDDGALGGGVDRGRLVAAHRLRLLARARPGRVARRRTRSPANATDETNLRVPGRESRLARVDQEPRQSFGKKQVLFCGIVSPRLATANTSSMRVGRISTATSAWPIHGTHGLRQSGV